MTCSKIFSELPELLSEIIQYFRCDFSALHSCILVDRLWCRLAIPLLWENPFSIIHRGNCDSIEHYKIRFIEIYLANLNDDDKIKLNKYGVELLSNTLFNYPSFIKHLYMYSISNSIKKWVATIEKFKRILQFIDGTQDLDFTSFVYKSLIKIFIENEAKLHTFKVTNQHEHFDIISELVLQSSNFIYNIKHLDINLVVSYGAETNDIRPLLKFLSSNCNSISAINFSSVNKHKFNIVIKCLSQLINSQKNLKKIFFNNYFPYSALLDSNCLNNLNTITFSYVSFENINCLTEVFEQLNVLESIHIFNCFSLDFNFVQQIINITKPFKLKSLFVSEMFESIELLLQKSGSYLENFGFQSFEIDEDNNNRSEYHLLELESQLLESESLLIESITKYCTKIKFFELLEFNNQNIYSAFNLIVNTEQNLNYLSIDLSYNYGTCDDELSSIIVLRNLGQILPFKLEYLNLSLSIDTFDLTDFEIFLKNSQNTFIKKLLFYNIIEGTREKMGQDGMINYIKKYIMKEERVRYLAFQNNPDNGELFYLEDEVKEFKSHNITIQKYNDLYISFFNMIKND
ncbi:hypothetical protein RclHR1_08820001 [Rhizophagus clarus]|uniref:F-box domain-containing protein n=2 Tax=Rhizophagus clarus TaxID=94130 RepID=A0A2Z6SG63_9GLOM|nr:hypothetical protein RclHR1_08820001 [Rhizophagus clarus]GES91805.1 hypothetical protein GLOIN_2v1776887 [Rhizophagus clarus]